MNTNKISDIMNKENQREIGIILCGSKWDVPKSDFFTQMEKIIERESERGETVYKFYYYGEDSAHPFILRAKDWIEEKGEGYELIPVLKNWYNGRRETGRRRDERLCESSNYLLCFSKSLTENKTAHYRWILDMARKEKLIVREITSPEALNSSPSSDKKLTPGLNLSLTPPVKTEENE